MFRLIVAGLWLCLVAFGMVALGARSKHPATEKSAADKDRDKISDSTRNKALKPVSVPIIIKGRVHGYLVVQLNALLNSDVKSHLSVPLDVFVEDEVFRVLFGAYSDVRDVEKVKFDDVRQKIVDGVNRRFAVPVLQDVLVKQFSFIHVDEVPNPVSSPRSKRVPVASPAF